MADQFKVTPAELQKASKEFSGLADNYREEGAKLKNRATQMGKAWEGSDNQEFVRQMEQLAKEIGKMEDKLRHASKALDTQAQNYINQVAANKAALPKFQ